MKKILIGIAVIIAFIIIAYKVSYSLTADYTTDLFGTGPNHEFRVGSDGTVYTTEGFPHSIEWMDVPTASTGAFVNTTNGNTISTATLVSGGTTFVEGATGTVNQFTQITFPRNVVCVVSFIQGYSSATVTGTLTVSGKDAKGNSTTEAIAISTGTAAVPGIGVKAWSFIDSLALSGMTIVCYEPATAPTAHIWIGTGNKIGIGYDVLEATDVYKTTVDHVDFSTCSYKSLNGVNVTYDTLDTSKLGGNLIPNAARDYRIWLKTGINH